VSVINHIPTEKETQVKKPTKTQVELPTYIEKDLTPAVGIIMGSKSDLPVMQEAVEVLKSFGVNYELNIVSAHRTPLRMVGYAQTAYEKGMKVIIAGAGGAAHLPGMVASITTLPVIGVPIKSSNSIDGWDSILSILQMPNGIPVATVALNAAKNAGLLAIQMLAMYQPDLQKQLVAFREQLREKVERDVELLYEEEEKKKSNLF
jgi:5-(carboxyamino)imidazole ribonucleotide mutase